MARPYSNRSYAEVDPGMYDDEPSRPYESEAYQRRSPSDRDQYPRTGNRQRGQEIAP